MTDQDLKSIATALKGIKTSIVAATKAKKTYDDKFFKYLAESQRIQEEQIELSKTQLSLAQKRDKESKGISIGKVQFEQLVSDEDLDEFAAALKNTSFSDIISKIQETREEDNEDPDNI